jgi:NADPH-dependent glutamate synthase beta subunit-like oxidoreductase
MSAAYHLRRMGHAVTVSEAGPAMGGMMRFGIPKYRLPRDVLDAEDAAHHRHGRDTAAQHQGRRHRAGHGRRRLRRRLPRRRRPHRQAHLHSGQGRLAHPGRGGGAAQMEGEDKPMLGRRVVVYGGGNTAIDVARTAKRWARTEAIIVYRRTREKMPAHDFEVEEALEEGVMVKWLSTIKQAGEGALTIEKMKLDEKGNPQPTGEFETLEADSLVLALGQDVDLSLLDGVPGLELKDGVVQVNAQTMMTGHAGIFAGGDMVPAERNVTVAIGHGKRPRGTSTPGCAACSCRPKPPKHETVATFDKLNTWYYTDAPKTVRPHARHDPAPDQL